MPRDDYARTTAETDLLHQGLELRRLLTSPDADRHLFHGFMQRLQMIQLSRQTLLREADAADESPRSTNLATELSLHANAYYLNVRGALDNLAWILQFQWGLFPNTSDQAGQRMLINLFDTRFIAAVSASHPAFAVALGSWVTWGTDISDRRDPAAHRIPLRVPHSVLSESEAQRYQALFRESNDLMAQGRHEEGMARLHETSSLGTFHAWLVTSGPRGPQQVPLHLQVATDHDRFLDISEATFAELRSRLPPVAT